MLHTHEVTGSSPVVSTKTKPPSKRWWFLFWWLRDSNPFQWERCDYNLCGGMASRNVAAMIHRHPALGAGIVVHLNLLRTMKKRMSFRPQRSGVEESTTLEKNQHKIKSATWEDSSTRFRSLGMTYRGVVPFCPHGLYSERCMVVLRAANQNLLIAGGNHTLIPSMDHRRYIAWYRSTAQVVFGTWRAANSRPYRRSTFAPIVPTMRNVLPPIILPQRKIPTGRFRNRFRGGVVYLARMPRV